MSSDENDMTGIGPVAGAAGVASLKLMQTLANGTTPLTALLSSKKMIAHERDRLAMYVEMARIYPELRGLLGVSDQLSLPSPDPKAYEGSDAPPVAQIIAAHEAGLLPEHAGSNDPLWLQFYNERQREQHNLEATVKVAAEELDRRVATGEEPSLEPVNKTWASRFFAQARLIQEEELQAAWGRLLAGEVMRPGCYSPRTLQVLEAIGSEDAELWSRFVSLSFIVQIDESGSPRVALGMLPSHSAAEGGPIGHVAIMSLAALGLIDSVTSAFIPAKIMAGKKSPMQLTMQPYGLSLTLPVDSQTQPINGYLFTRAGRELAGLVTEPSVFEEVSRVAEVIHAAGYNVHVVGEKAERVSRFSEITSLEVLSFVHETRG